MTRNQSLVGLRHLRPRSPLRDHHRGLSRSPTSLILNQDPEARLPFPRPLLGIDNASEYQASIYQLPEGGKLILHSDGFESLNRGRNTAQINVQNAWPRLGPTQTPPV